MFQWMIHKGEVSYAKGLEVLYIKYDVLYIYKKSVNWTFYHPSNNFLFREHVHAHNVSSVPSRLAASTPSLDMHLTSFSQYVIC